MCNDAVDVDRWSLYDVPDYFKRQKLCGDVVQRDSYSLQFAPDWFVTQEPLEIWHDDNDYCTDDGDHWDNDGDEDKFFEWYDGYKKRKVQNAKIK